MEQNQRPTHIGPRFSTIIMPDPAGGDCTIGLRVKGYGCACTQDGYGECFAFDVFEGKVQLLVWADINQEDPTHTIDLSGAREDARRELCDACGEELVGGSLFCDSCQARNDRHTEEHAPTGEVHRTDVACRPDAYGPVPLSCNPDLDDAYP